MSFFRYCVNVADNDEDVDVGVDVNVEGWQRCWLSGVRHRLAVRRPRRRRRVCTAAWAPVCIPAWAPVCIPGEERSGTSGGAAWCTAGEEHWCRPVKTITFSTAEGLHLQCFDITATFELGVLFNSSALLLNEPKFVFMLKQ